MKRTRPTQSAIAQELRSSLQGKTFYRYKKWYFWNRNGQSYGCHCPRWQVLPLSELQRRIQLYLDEHPDFEAGYSSGFVASIERLLRGYLAFNQGDFTHKDRENPNLLAGVLSVGEAAR